MTRQRPYGDVYVENARLRHENDRMLSMLLDLAMKSGGEISANGDWSRESFEIEVMNMPIPLGEVRIRARRIQTVEGTVVPNGQKVIEG